MAVSCNGNPVSGAALNVTSDLPASSLPSSGVTDSNGNYMVSGTVSTNEPAGTHTITVNAIPSIGCDPGKAAANLQVAQLSFTDVLSNTLTSLFSGTVTVGSLLLVVVLITIIVTVALLFKKKWKGRAEPKTNENTHTAQ